MRITKHLGPVSALLLALVVPTACRVEAIADASSSATSGGGGGGNGGTAVTVTGPNGSHGPFNLTCGATVVQLTESPTVAGTWFSTNSGIATNNMGFVQAQPGVSGSTYPGFRPSDGGRADSVLVTVNTVGCNGGVTVTTSPSPLNLFIGASTCGPTSGQISAPAGSTYNSENGTVAMVSTTGLVTPTGAGSTTITVRDKNGVVIATVPETSTVCSSGSGTLNFSANPSSIVSGQLSTLSWSSNNTTSCLASGGWSGTKGVSGTEQVSPTQTTTYTLTCTGPGVSVSQSQTVTVTSPSPVVTSLVVSPKRLDLLIGQSASLFASGTTSNGSVMPTPSWVATLGCVQLSSNSGTQINVTGVRACRDSVVASSGGKQDFAIVVVTSGVNSISYTPAGGSVVVGNTQQLTATCTLANNAVCNPYWYSYGPNIFTVVGAPNVCVVAGVSYPCGPTATIKAIAAGSTNICVQAALADPTVFFCSTKTALATTSGSISVSSNLMFGGKEMILPNSPPPVGAKLDKVMTWLEWQSSGR